MINEYSTYFPYAIMLSGFILGYVYRWLSDRKTRKEVLRTVNDIKETLINSGVKIEVTNPYLPKQYLTRLNHYEGMRKV